MGNKPSPTTDNEINQIEDNSISTTQRLKFSQVAAALEPNSSSSQLSSSKMSRDSSISEDICKIAATFWQQNIEILSISEQLEIGLAIFFGMVDTNEKMKKFTNRSQSVEQTSLRCLDMMGWLMRNLATDNVALRSLLTQLGQFHQKMGINANDFSQMLQSMHETFAFYFESNYSIEVHYAMDEIFSIATQMMMGKAENRESLKPDYINQNLPFLKNLRYCLASSIGKKYLCRYLEQTYCDEMSMFLQYLSHFKCKTSVKERFVIASDIAKKCINQQGIFGLNISYETRTDIIRQMSALEKKFAMKQPFEITTEFFAEAEREVHKLIKQNHWKKFVEDMEGLHNKKSQIYYVSI